MLSKRHISICSDSGIPACCQCTAARELPATKYLGHCCTTCYDYFTGIFNSGLILSMGEAKKLQAPYNRVTGTMRQMAYRTGLAYLFARALVCASSIYVGNHSRPTKRLERALAAFLACKQASAIAGTRQSRTPL